MNQKEIRRKVSREIGMRQRVQSMSPLPHATVKSGRLEAPTGLSPGEQFPHVVLVNYSHNVNTQFLILQSVGFKNLCFFLPFLWIDLNSLPSPTLFHIFPLLVRKYTLSIPSVVILEILWSILNSKSKSLPLSLPLSQVDNHSPSSFICYCYSVASVLRSDYLLLSPLFHTLLLLS